LGYYRVIIRVSDGFAEPLVAYFTENMKLTEETPQPTQDRIPWAATHTENYQFVDPCFALSEVL
jgi:hypothetical protein